MQIFKSVRYCVVNVLSPPNLVEVLGRTGLCYREDGRQMFVDSEVLTGSSGMAVYKDTIQKWNPLYDNVRVTDSDRDRILNNIRDAFRSQGFEIDVI